MIIPLFRLSQTPDTLTIEITAKYISLKSLDFIAENDKIYFYCKPYHLKLHLPGSVNAEILSSKYDCDNGLFTFVLKKTTPGEEFKNLDLITRLLEPVVEKKKTDKILILDDDHNVLWENTPEISYKYGFGMKGLHDFHRVIDEYVDVLKVDPRKIDIEERMELMRAEEFDKFDVDHYIADYVEEELIIEELLDVDSPWKSMTKESLRFDDSELEILKNLPNKNYDLTESQRKYCYYSLIDILFAYCYDCRTTSFEGNSESGWTILEIAASLGWLVGFENAKSAVVSGYRRSLMYPLYRNYKLCNKIFEDVKIIIALGEVCIMKALLHIYKIFLEGDQCRFILNDIFIKDYLTYVGKWEEDEWNRVAEEISNMNIEKEDLNIPLKEIERDFLCRILQDQLDSDDESDDYEEIPEDLIRRFKERLVLIDKDDDVKQKVNTSQE